MDVAYSVGSSSIRKFRYQVCGSLDGVNGARSHHGRANVTLSNAFQKDIISTVSQYRVCLKCTDIDVWMMRVRHSVLVSQATLNLSVGV